MLRGRSAVVSGASRGIGFACARALHAAGARVILLARGSDTVGQAADELGDGATGIACDLSDDAAIARAVGAMREILGGAPDVLVNNAGAFVVADAADTSPAEFDRVLRVNLSGVVALVHAFLPDMRARGSGQIVTIGSVADRHAFPGNAAYAASKFGARGLHEVLRAELRGTGIRVTLVSPGPTDTALWDDVDPDSRPGFTRRSDMLDVAAVADAVRFAVTRPAGTNIDELRLSRT